MENTIHLTRIQQYILHGEVVLRIMPRNTMLNSTSVQLLREQFPRQQRSLHRKSRQQKPEKRKIL